MLGCFARHRSKRKCKCFSDPSQQCCQQCLPFQRGHQRTIKTGVNSCSLQFAFTFFSNFAPQMNVRFLLASLVFLLLGGNIHSLAGYDVHGLFTSSTVEHIGWDATNYQQARSEKITAGNTGFPAEFKSL